jgi:hypothetical protein
MTELTVLWLDLHVSITKGGKNRHKKTVVAVSSLAIGAAGSAVTPHQSFVGIWSPAAICYVDSTQGKRRMWVTHF